jgi:hypothetical protein
MMTPLILQFLQLPVMSFPSRSKWVRLLSALFSKTSVTFVNICVYSVGHNRFSCIAIYHLVTVIGITKAPVTVFFYAWLLLRNCKVYNSSRNVTSLPVVHYRCCPSQTVEFRNLAPMISGWLPARLHKAWKCDTRNKHRVYVNAICCTGSTPSCAVNPDLSYGQY